MSAYLDLDDVAAQSQLAARELAEAKARIAELERSHSEFVDARRAWLASDAIKQSAIDRLRAEVEALREFWNCLRSLSRHVERMREAGLVQCDDTGPEDWARELLAAQAQAKGGAE